MQCPPSFTWRRPLAVVLLALVACRSEEPTSPESPGAGSKAPEATTSTGGALALVPLTIVDWNTRDYFDTTDDAWDDDVLAPLDYTRKRQTIGAELKALSADIVVVAEVEKQAILDDLNTSELGDVYTQTILKDGNDPRGINVGILTKIAPDRVVSHKNDVFVLLGTTAPNYRYSRDCLEVHFTVNHRKIILLGVHFKSKATPDNPEKRLAESQHTRKIADDLLANDPEASVLVLGDFNDTPGSLPLTAMVGAPPNAFADSADAVATAQRYSYDYQGKLELIDHQMASPSLGAMLDPAQVALEHGAGIDDGTQYASDHSPLIATYQVR